MIDQLDNFPFYKSAISGNLLYIPNPIQMFIYKMCWGSSFIYNKFFP